MCRFYTFMHYLTSKSFEIKISFSRKMWPMHTFIRLKWSGNKKEKETKKKANVSISTACWTEISHIVTNAIWLEQQKGEKASQVVVESPNIILASILFIKLGECGCGQQHLTYFIILLYLLDEMTIAFLHVWK